MVDDAKPENPLRRTRGRRELLAMVHADKTWAEMTDDERRELAAKVHRQMLVRLDGIRGRNDQ